MSRRPLSVLALVIELKRDVASFLVIVARGQQQSARPFLDCRGKAAGAATRGTLAAVAMQSSSSSGEDDRDVDARKV